METGKSAPAAAPAPAERHVTAGPAALARAARLLGLRAAAGWRLEGLCAFGERGEGLRAQLRGPGLELALHLAPDSPGGVRLTAEGPTGPAVSRLLEAWARRLGGRGLERLVAAIEEDPESFVERVEQGCAERVRVPCIGQPLALLEAGWRNFYADQDFEVLLGVPSCSDQRTVNIEYADLECYYARPKRSFKKWTFLEWPEENDEPQGGERGGEGGAGSIVTELEEQDMIMGTGARADALVEAVRRRAKPGDFLLFTHLCTPIIMGEDFSGLARRCEREVGGTAVRWSQKDRDENDNFGDHLRDLLARPGFFEGPDDPLAVNLYHFPKACREAELVPFLEELGIKTNLRVFPEVELGALERLPAARWQIFCERSSYPTKLQEILSAYPRPQRRVAAPYGIAGTRDCLRAIAETAGRRDAFEAAWERKMERFLPAWSTLRREAAGHRIAFVVSEATLPRLLELRYGFGAPLAAMALEMGFGIDLLYYERHGQAPALPPALARAGVSVFRTPFELSRALSEGAFSAVYSDVFFDWRISRAGKARFSSKDFEMGLDGAARTFEKLLSLCRLPFYRRYAAHLAARPRRAP